MFLATLFAVDFYLPNYRTFPSFLTSKNVSLLILDNVSKLEITNTELSSWQEEEEKTEKNRIEILENKL
jgi:hypothetical protein